MLLAARQLQGEDGAHVRSAASTSRSRSRYRQTTVLLKNPSLFLPPMLFPLMNFMAFAGGLSRLRHVPGLRLHTAATPRSSSCSCSCSRPRSAASSPASGSRATSSAASRSGCSSRRRSGAGSSSATALASLDPLADDRVRPDDRRAARAACRSAASGVDLFGLYALAIIFNQVGLLWAVRRRDALPLGRRPGR